ncbi:MAG: hypothetical protein Q4D58_08300 [Synergistaceae bacterium]|nr:hypothetical protein [Synergistaceae bacterium]
MEEKHSVFKMVLLTSASFAGYNIGSGFATGIEALQFFSSWGALRAFTGISIALAAAAVFLSAVYLTGYERQFNDSKQVYRYLCGKRVGAVFDYYIYISMILVTLTMMSGAGATINQYSGLPTYAGAALMGIMCVVTSLLGLEKLRKILSYMCILILLFVFSCAVYAAFTSALGPIEGSAKVERYVASGQILRASAFGFMNPYLGGLASAGVLINSGFAWASATGALCKSRKEALLSGVFSAVFFYLSTAVVVYLILISIDHVAGKEVPMMAVIQYFLPGLSAAYSCIIILAIFSTISGRLFLIGVRYGRGNKNLTLAVVTGITVFASVGASFIPFSKISNMTFAICGAVGFLLGVIVLTRYCMSKRGQS